MAALPDLPTGHHHAMNIPTTGRHRPYDAQELARYKLACDRAREVFGDNHPEGGWIHRCSTEFGEWESPCHMAATSDEVLALVLARLDELAKTITPVWMPVFKGQRKRVFKHRR